MKKYIFLISILAYFHADCQNCAIAFTSHQTASVVTSRQITIAGTAATPIEGHLWILAHIEGFDEWWLQGNGERKIIANKWNCLVFLGQADETGNFEIAAIVVNDQVNQALKNKVARAKDEGYPSIPMPDVLEGCEIKIIKIEKRK